MNCRCPACPCPHDRSTNTPNSLVAPTNFFSVQYLTPYITRVCNLFEYLMVTEQTNYNRSYAVDEYTKILEFADNFVDSPMRTFSPISTMQPGDSYYVYDDAVEKVFAGLNGYLKKCKDLIVLRDDAITAPRMFPLTFEAALNFGL